MGHYRNALLTDEGRDKSSKPDLVKDSNTDIDTNNCAKVLLNDPLNLNLPGYIFERKYYGIPIPPPKYLKGS